MSGERTWWRLWFGTRSERAAAAYLRQLGWQILGSNVAIGGGELDLIALCENTIVFVEIRSTGQEETLDIAESIGRTKQEVLTRTALNWLTSKNLLDQPARFDVLLVSWPRDQSEPRIEHIPHAFDATDRGQMYS